jgi:hypothetical protein
VIRFEAIGIPKQDVWIILHEVPMANSGIRGGMPASKVNLGCRVGIWLEMWRRRVESRRVYV